MSWILTAYKVTVSSVVYSTIILLVGWKFTVVKDKITKTYNKSLQSVWNFTIPLRRNKVWYLQKLVSKPRNLQKFLPYGLFEHLPERNYNRLL